MAFFMHGGCRAAAGLAESLPPFGPVLVGLTASRGLCSMFLSMFRAQEMASVAMPIDSLQKRVADLRRAFAKGLGHKPSTLQAAAIRRAALLAAQAEQVLA